LHYKQGGGCVIADWIFEENLAAFLMTLGWIIGYEVEDEELAVIAYGISDSDGDHDRWYLHELIGNHRAQLMLACDQGCGVVQVRVDGPIELEPQVELAIQIFNRYHVS
jgi:hypothetical protein